MPRFEVFVHRLDEIRNPRGPASFTVEVDPNRLYMDQDQLACTIRNSIIERYSLRHPGVDASAVTRSTRLHPDEPAPETEVEPAERPTRYARRPVI